MARQDDMPVAIRAWQSDDLDLLKRLMGDAEMTAHLGGPESADRIRDRHHRYLSGIAPGEGQMFVIIAGDEEIPCGSSGYWLSEWGGEKVWEAGWSVLPEFQGMGIASRATALVLARARAEATFRHVHAFPSIDNAASNAICRKLGFRCLGPVDIEYPVGTFMRANNWRLDLFSGDV